MKLLYPRAVFVTGVLSAVSDSALESNEPEAAAPVARAHEHTTVKKLLRTDSVVEDEQEERVFWGFMDDVLNIAAQSVDTAVGTAIDVIPRAVDDVVSAIDDVYHAVDNAVDAAMDAEPSIRASATHRSSAHVPVPHARAREVSHSFPVAIERLDDLKSEAISIILDHRSNLASPPHSVEYTIKYLDKFTPFEGAYVMQAVKSHGETTDKVLKWMRSVEDSQLQRMREENVRPDELRSSWLEPVRENGVEYHEEVVEAVINDFATYLARADVHLQ
ncbi:unnamed protein product [Hyaloperonospora brassicae]|uniref:RxLR effector candidate protein n=1 Tax=Hyaloperonospora brassicae TaxID=162125 RepID=A0AAV0TC84_HYABA|nr:unnamed protein product [Hyaloperonospora brassicae]